MKQENIIKKAKKLGYKIKTCKYIYWDNEPAIIRDDGSLLSIVSTYNPQPGTTSLKTDFKWDDVECALGGSFDSMGAYEIYWEN